MVKGTQYFYGRAIASKFFSNLRVQFSVSKGPILGASYQIYEASVNGCAVRRGKAMDCEEKRECSIGLKSVHYL